MTFQELLTEYLFYKYLRPASVNSYQRAVNKISAALPGLAVEEVEQHHILRWRSKELAGSLSPTSWNTYIRHLVALFNFGINHNLLPQRTNPLSGTSVTQPKKPKKTLSQNQIKAARAILAEMHHYETTHGKRAAIHPAWFWQVVFETFYHSGIRLNQLIHIQLRDVNLNKGLIRIRIEGSKTWREYNVPIALELRPWLKLLLDQAKLLKFELHDQLFNVNRFSNYHTRKLMTIWQVENCFKKISKRLKVKVSPHRFRHTLGTELMRRPERNLHGVRDLLGHTNIRTTLEYIDVDLAMLRQLVNERQ